MEELKQRILREGQVLPGGILKVDGFVNHQVDPALMMACGHAFAAAFAKVGATKIFTLEISGIAPALTTAIALNLPLVYARKTKPVTMPDLVLMTSAPSHTKNRMVDIMTSPEYLGRGERVLIIDDFLASGQTTRALIRLVQGAGSTVVGIGALIEKTFEGGRESLEDVGAPIVALAQITSLEGGIHLA
ncbi:MAG: xanthine phosphoribosyltransferase [Thermoflexales bacterium]|nr:xanthine phosphoribosyltransferase [Thermoflexales bacterium]